MSVAKQIIKQHLVEGELNEGKEIAIRIDQTLTQDATGTMAYLQFEALNIKKVKTDLSVSYVDHNISETGQQNIEFLETFADNYGIIFSKPNNGICHQVHLERFAKPGKTLTGSDSHTPTAGGIASLAIGVGGLDIAAAMAGYPFYLSMPKVVGIRLIGKLNDWVSAKDIILYLLKKYSVKGGVGKIFEYFGDGVKTLTVPERSTITNMGAELGLTTSIFPSDNMTKQFLGSQKREKDFKELSADEAEFDDIIEIKLGEIEPLIAQPSSPDKVIEVKNIEGKEVRQVLIGSCTNSSYKDLAMVATVLKYHRLDDNVNFNINPGSQQVIKTLKQHNLSLPESKICQAACLGCIGMGQSPEPNTITLRTFNRNFKGRSGTKEDFNYLCSPETAIASAIKGKITDPRNLGAYPHIILPDEFVIDDSGLIGPTGKKEIKRGELIAPLPLNQTLKENIIAKVLIKLGDNITTDDIMPAGQKILPLRSHIPKISEYIFHHIDETFAKRAKETESGIIVGGENYGQGSSREHAALAPMHLGIKAVIAKSFARIHKSNLINFGILPLEFKNKEDYNKITKDGRLELNNIIDSLKNDKDLITNGNIQLTYTLSETENDIIISGGKLNYIKNKLD
ncbi:MAG: aconitate hydratase [Nanoarchaeota archaeon]